MLNGHSPGSEEPPLDPEKAMVGRKLVSRMAVFSVSVATRSGLCRQVFDAQGINLAKVGDRLLPEYFRRWMSSPLRVDPQTKMPAYFNQGQSALFDIRTAMRGSRLRRCTITSGWAARWCRRRRRAVILLKNPACCDGSVGAGQMDSIHARRAPLSWFNRL